MSQLNQARDHTNRSHLVTFRLSDDEYEQLKAVCEILGVTQSEYLRQTALTATFGKPIIHITLDAESARVLTGQFGKIGSNLNQIARKLNQNEALTEQLRSQINDCLCELHKGTAALSAMKKEG